jgi:hypothetical protein
LVQRQRKENKMEEGAEEGELTTEEIWDDSVLIEAFNRSVQHYKVISHFD